MKKVFYNIRRRLSREILNFLFPVECIGCGGDENWICAKCRADVPRPTALSCFFCRRGTTDGRFCDDCRRGKTLSGIWASAPYDAEILRRSIHVLKYRSQYVFAESLASFLVQFSRTWPFLFLPSTLFIPVPLHKKKFNERGYNQSHLLLASFLSVRGNGACGCWLLSRSRHTKQQVDCSRDERLQNVADAFRYRGPHTHVWSRVVLVDDVATTGTTLEECARALHDAGARDIWGFALAKG